MNKAKAGLAGIVMALASMMSPTETEARNPQIQHSHNHNRRYWSNYNLRTFYGYPQFQQPWQRMPPIQPAPIVINTGPTIINNSSATQQRSNAGRRLFYVISDSVYDIAEAGWPERIKVINKQDIVFILERTTLCPEGGNCKEGTRLPYMNGPREFWIPPTITVKGGVKYNGYHYKIIEKIE